MRRVVFSAVAALFCLLAVRAAQATVNCVYTGTGCNAGYSATAEFECLTDSLLLIVITNTSTIDDSSDPSNNILASISFGGPSPVDSAADSATVAPGSSLLPAGLVDCGGSTNGPDVTCEWAAGPDFCPSCDTGADPSCPTPRSQCGLSFVSSRQSSDANCTGAFVLDTGSIDGSSDGPDFGVINVPTQARGGQEAIDDTVEIIVQVEAGTCVESNDFCSGVATYGSHFRHAPGDPATPMTTTTTATTSTTTTTATTPTTQPTTTSTASTSTTSTSTVTSTASTSTATTSTSTATTSTTLGAIFNDPTKIVFRRGRQVYDKFQGRGRIVSPPSIDKLSGDVTLRLANSSGVIWEGTLFAGDCEVAGDGRRCKWRDRGAREGAGVRHGIEKFKMKQIRSRLCPGYSVSWRVFEDLSAATDPEMTVRVSIAGPEVFEAGGQWTRTSKGWKFRFQPRRQCH